MAPFLVSLAWYHFICHMLWSLIRCSQPGQQIQGHITLHLLIALTANLSDCSDLRFGPGTCLFETRKAYFYSSHSCLPYEPPPIISKSFVFGSVCTSKPILQKEKCPLIRNSIFYKVHQYLKDHNNAILDDSNVFFFVICTTNIIICSEVIFLFSYVFFLTF